jgi:hypothetical protein
VVIETWATRLALHAPEPGEEEAGFEARRVDLVEFSALRLRMRGEWWRLSRSGRRGSANYERSCFPTLDDETVKDGAPRFGGIETWATRLSVSN